MKLSLDRGKLKSRWIITPLFTDRIPAQITTFTKMIIIKCSPLILLRPSILLIILYTNVSNRLDFKSVQQFSKHDDRLSFRCKGQTNNTCYFYLNHRILYD